MTRITPLIFCFVIFACASVEALDWPQWRGPKRNGISEETGWSTMWPADGPKKLWQTNVGIGYASMSVVQGKLYTMGNISETDHVYCLDAATGKRIWDHEYACPSEDPNGFPGTRCTPTLDGDRVYTVSREGHLFCLNATNGKVVWSKNFQKDFRAEVPTWGFSGSPLVEVNLLLVEVGGPGASVVAFNKMDGSVVWKAGSDQAGYASLVPYDYAAQRCFAVFSREHIVGRAMRGGVELWRYPWKTSYGVNAATPIIEGDKLFVSSGYSFGCAVLQFSARPPRVVWQNKNMRTHVSSCVLWKGHIYGFDESELRCLDFATGKVNWSDRSFGKGSLLIADGKLIVYSENGKLAVAEASPTAFKPIANAQVLGGRTTWVTPVLANGTIYCRSMDKLIALDVREK